MVCVQVGGIVSGSASSGGTVGELEIVFCRNGGVDFSKSWRSFRLGLGGALAAWQPRQPCAAPCRV